MPVITRDLLTAYVNCSYKANLCIKGVAGVKSDFELLHRELWKTNYPLALAEPLEACNESQLSIHENSPGEFPDAKEEPKIVNFRLQHDDFDILFDLLETVGERSKPNELHYSPVVFSSEEKVKKPEKLLITMMSIILGKVQNQVPEKGRIVYGNSRKTAKVKTKTYLDQAAKALNEIEVLLKQQKEPKFFLNQHCEICQFQEFCRAKATEMDHLGLLRGMSQREIIKQNEKGIFTVTQLSYTFRPRKRRRRKKGYGTARHYALQALAIREEKVHIFEKADLEMAPNQIYLDIEGLPDEGYEYLIGMVILENGEEYQPCASPNKEPLPQAVLPRIKGGIHSFARTDETASERKMELLTGKNRLRKKRYSFWADTPGDEQKIFQEFLRIVSRYDSFQLFHYGDYEKRFIRRMKKMCAGKDEALIESILDNSTNVLSLIHSNVYFPTYSNQLKEVAGYMGCQWTSTGASGLQSIVWRKKWEMTGSIRWKQKLIAYNIEDCENLHKVVTGIENILSNDPTRCEFDVVLADDLKSETGGPKFGNIGFCLDEFAYVNKAAYFDYQREKVFVRTNKKLRSLQKKKRTRYSLRANKVVKLKCIKCPCCRSLGLQIVPDKMRNKTVFDLRFFKHGLKRVVTKYLANLYMCPTCEECFYPLKFKKLRKYSHNLKAWVAYQYVLNQISFVKIERYIGDVFKIPISFHAIYKMKSSLAKYYEIAYTRIIKRLIAGDVIHIDETGIRLRQTKGYVWVLTNMEEVCFIYRESREGHFLTDLLREFQGVLISDFYSAYDSLRCEQQKCLVHLIRDLNGDLYKNPYDEEFKAIAKNFGKLLSMIVQTIDKYGLKKRHLRKHEGDVKRFYDATLRQQFESSLATRYQKRFEKYKSKIFVFLRHDGVTWNNNNAENAIKYLAQWRRLVAGKITENGIRDYCIFLS
jgi:predicted RecB family nuclease